MRTVTVLLIALLLCACGGSRKNPEQSTREPDQPAAREAAQEAAEPESAETLVVVDLASRKVSCGCAIEGIGTCGNHIEIDGSFVPIANSSDLGLGPMEWCGKEHVTAESSGELRDGEFHADTLVVDASD